VAPRESLDKFETNTSRPYIQIF